MQVVVLLCILSITVSFHLCFGLKWPTLQKIQIVAQQVMLCIPLLHMLVCRLRPTCILNGLIMHDVERLSSTEYQGHQNYHHSSPRSYAQTCHTMIKMVLLADTSINLVANMPDASTGRSKN